VTIAEPDVTLTDYALTVECAILAWLLYRQGARGDSLRDWFIVFFCAAGFAAFTGGTSHGFIYDEMSLAYAIFWKATLVAIGVAALAAWMIGISLLSSRAYTARIRAAAFALFGVYLVALFFVDSFLIAIVHYVPAVLFLLFVCGKRYIADREVAFIWGVVGLLLTFAAAAVQQTGIGLHPDWFNHNALYHLMQGVALLFLFAAARAILRNRETVSC
jgi:hypothetical protein